MILGNNMARKLKRFGKAVGSFNRRGTVAAATQEPSSRHIEGTPLDSRRYTEAAAGRVIVALPEC